MVKYRKKILQNDVDLAMKKIITAVEGVSDFKVDAMESDGNHIHILVDSVPKLSPLQIIRRIKSISTNRIWKVFPKFLKNYFWKEKTFWSDGYFVCTTGQVSTEIVLKYNFLTYVKTLETDLCFSTNNFKSLV